MYLVCLWYGCRSDRNVNPNLQASALGVSAIWSVGSRSLRLWLDFYLNYFLVVADACKGFNHKYVFFQVREVH